MMAGWFFLHADSDVPQYRLIGEDRAIPVDP